MVFYIFKYSFIISEYETLGNYLFGCFALSSVLCVISWLLSPSLRAPNRVYSYECGYSPFLNNNIGFNSQIYQIAILFILFDVEVALLFPLVYFKITMPSHCIVIFSFLTLLILGLMAEINGGLLDFYNW